MTIANINPGTGIWAIEFGASLPICFRTWINDCAARDFPKATVLGTDLSPIQPS